MSTDTREILERRLGLALDFQGLLAAELKQMRAWRNKWRTRTREFRDRAVVAEAVVRSLRSELATATASLGSAQAVANLQAEVTDLRRQKTDLETALGAAVAGWNKDKDILLKTRLTLGMTPHGTDHVESVAAGVKRQAMEAADLRAQLDTARLQAGRAHDEDMALRAQLDAATKRAELAEATLESVRAAVAKPVEDKQDTRPKVGDAVPWSEVEAGALYYRPGLPYAFRGVTDKRQCLLDGPHDEDLTRLLHGGGNPLSELLGGYLSSPTGVLVARDLGSDPEAWRATMREHLAKVGA